MRHKDRRAALQEYISVRASRLPQRGPSASTPVRAVRGARPAPFPEKEGPAGSTGSRGSGSSRLGCERGAARGRAPDVHRAQGCTSTDCSRGVERRSVSPRSCGRASDRLTITYESIQKDRGEGGAGCGVPSKRRSEFSRDRPDGDILTTTLTTTRYGFTGVRRGFGTEVERENPAICGALWGCRRRIRTFTN